MGDMTAPTITAPAPLNVTHSLSALNSLPAGSIIAIGSYCAERTETGWLIPGIRKEHPTWSLVSMSGTTTAAVLREGK